MNIKTSLFGCYNGTTYCQWGTFDHNRPWDQMKWNLFQNVEWILDVPRNTRLKVANILSRWAHRLRYGKSYDFGYGIQENRAAHLASNLRFRLIPAPEGMEQDEANEALDEIAELEYMAHGTSWLK